MHFRGRVILLHTFLNTYFDADFHFFRSVQEHFTIIFLISSFHIDPKICIQGLPGDHGKDGDKGEEGVKGEPGPPGFQGDPGPQGRTGAPGIIGTRGKSGLVGGKVSFPEECYYPINNCFKTTLTVP